MDLVALMVFAAPVVGADIPDPVESADHPLHLLAVLVSGLMVIGDDDTR